MSLKKQYPESLKNFTVRMMQALKGTYQNFRPDENPDQAVAYAEAIKRMVEEFGQGRTAAAIAKACDLVPDFVPTPGKIREFMPARQGELTTCTLCHPSGFVMVYEGKTAGGNRIDPQYGAVKRCDHSAGKSPVKDPELGEGYGTNDVKLLWKLFEKKRLAVGRPLKEQDTGILLDELDQMTGRKA
jgi:hypothetical protein